MKNVFLTGTGDSYPLHGIPERVGDSALKDAGGVAVEGFQSSGGQTAGGAAAHGEIHVQNELDLGWGC